MPDQGLAAGSEGSGRFRAAQWRMLLATMFCYLFYYTGRHSFGFIAKGLKDDLGMGTRTIGTIGGGLLLCYGIGQAINGNLGDKFGARRLMSLGAVLSVGLNWVTSFGQSFWSVLVPWSANGYVQSLGWAPGSRLITNWWGHKERGRAFGLYVFAAGCSGVLTFALCIPVLQHFGWRWVMRLPVLLLLVGGVVFYVIARDKPEDLGFAPPPESDAEDAAPAEEETSLQRYLHALKNPRFLLACLAIGCQSTARYGLIFWVPGHYLGENWKKDPSSAWITLALPIGMALGALTAGQLSDRVFHSKRSTPIAVFLALAAAAVMLVYIVPPERKLAGVVVLFLAGFFVYGAQPPFWALCPDLLGRTRAGTAVGVMDAAAYGLGAVGQIAIGATIAATGQTGSAFAVVAGVCVLGAILILFVNR